MIPKIIWQTHEWDYEELPYDFKMASLTWKNLNPDWDYRYVSKKDREKYIEQYDKSILRFYNNCDGITQSDIWRYVVLYLHGGFYVDMDTHPRGKLNETVSKFDKSKKFFCMPQFYIDGIKRVVTGTHAAYKKSKICKNLVKDICLAKDKKAFSEDWVFKETERKLRLGWHHISDCVLKYEDSIGFNITEYAIKHCPNDEIFKYDHDLQVLIDSTWFFYKDLQQMDQSTNPQMDSLDDQDQHFL